MNDPLFFQKIREAGINVAEISLPPLRYADFDFVQAVERARAEGVQIRSVHLPFSAEISISHPDAALREASVRYDEDVLKRAGAAGIPYAVIHPSTEPIADEERQAVMEYALESLRYLAKVAKEAGLVLLVENLPRTCLGRSIDEIRTLLSADPSLCAIFDLNHLMNGETQEQFVLAHGDKLRSLHLSDYDLVHERHWMPGEGDIDWPAFLKALDRVGYDGPLLYEVSYKAPATIVRQRDLTPADFGENARYLLDGLTPPAIGAPVPDYQD